MKRTPSRDAYTLVELIVTIFLAAVITLSAITYFSAVSRAVTRPVITYNGANYTLSPVIRDNPDGVAKTDLFDALDLHLALRNQLNSADFIAIFGGSNADVGAPSALPPLQLGFNATVLPSLINISPQLLQTTPQIASVASADLAGQYETAFDASDFTLVSFQGVANITAIAQVRRHQSTFEGTAVSLYETTLRTRIPPAATWTIYAYRFWPPAAEDSWAVPMGARHSWYRAEGGWWNRSEPVGSSVAFPDPYVLAVPTPGATVLSQSRFAYFVTNSPAF